MLHNGYHLVHITLMTNANIIQSPYRAWDISVLDKLQTPPTVVLEEACNGEPVRVPKGHGTNIVSYVPSRKMNTMMICESRRLEMKACYLQELYRPVKAYYSQPYRFNVLRVDKNGTERSVSYVPDFLSILEAPCGHLHYVFVECKMVQSMLSKPRRFKKEANGRWTDYEVWPQLRELGFHLVVFSDEDVTPILKKNLSLLMPQVRAAALAEKSKRKQTS